MKKIIIGSLLILMLGYSIYEFVNSSQNGSLIDSDTEDFEIVDEEGNITEETTEAVGEIGINVGQTAPDFELSTLDGEVIRLSDYRGTPVMLNFWGSWCPPCRAEMPDMERFYQENNVEILAVNLTPTESNPDDVAAFVEDFGLNFTIPMDVDLHVSTAYGIRPVPTSYMIDSNGVIQNKALGAINYEQMVHALNMMD